MEEIWKEIPGYEGLYQVSNFGRVKSLNYNRTGKEKILKYGKLVRHHKERDYIRHYLTLCKKGKTKMYLIHRLVWISFNGNIPDNMQIDHINNNPEDNRLDNLQLLNRSENGKKKFIDNPDLSRSYVRHIEKIHPKKKIKCLNNNIIYESIQDASKKLKLNDSSISKVLRKKLNHTGGYIFEYV